MNRLYASLGDVQNWHHSGHKVVLHLADAEVSIVRYTDSVIRVLMRHHDNDSPELPYAVCEQPDGAGFTSVNEADATLRLSTSAVNIAVNLRPCRIAWHAPDGGLLAADDQGLGMGRMGDTVLMHRAIHEGERFIGLGEKTGPIDRRGQAFTHWNTDHFGYPEQADPIYLSTPFFMSVMGGRVSGLFLNNSHRSTFNFGASNDRCAIIQAEGGLLDQFFIAGADPSSIISSYTWLTGRQPLPPKWSLGYQQCRYSYYPEAEVMTLAKTFRDKQIPADVIYLDIHHMKDYKVFTFDEDRFPDVWAMNDRLRQMGFRTVVIADPGIKREQGYAAFDSGTKEDVFVKWPDGAPWAGQVWPGWSHFPDFTKEKAREWWADQVSFYTQRGVSGIWNDMNEPASWGQCSPDSVEFDWDGSRTTHREAHNVYGMLMAGASRQGAEDSMDGERPFILTRAGFSGIQRHAAVWTGDNVSTDAHMLAGVRLVSNMGMAGIAFAGYDVGGFVGEATPELFARWVSIGAFSPLFRGHTMIGTRDSEPWSFGETTEAVARNYIGLRYRLLPTIYTAMWQATCTGMPLVRSLAMLWPHDSMVYRPTYQDQYMFGDVLMVCPVESTRQLTRVYLPSGIWHDLHTDESYMGPAEVVVDCPIHRLPLFVKQGAPLLCQSAVQHTGQPHSGVLHIHVWFGAVGTARLYEDDGTTNACESGAFSVREVGYNCPDNLLTISAADGGYRSDFNRAKVVWHGFRDRAVQTVHVAGTTVQAKAATHRWTEPLPEFDPLGSAASDLAQNVFEVEFDLGAEEVILKWESVRT